MDMYQKRKMRAETKKNNQEKSSKAKISWLVCIYDGHHLNPYKIGVFKN